eukprot:GEMP01111497.1.p1 GENE.GEMP01111497.1~~GEMP01111497.1.p1  ORF type:complete len:116 (+),score=14.54 GEMP01111497.1:256-603(+)
MTHPGPHDSRLQDLQSVRETIVYQARPPVRGQRRLMKESQMQPASPQSLQRGPSSLRTTIALQPKKQVNQTDPTRRQRDPKSTGSSMNEIAKGDFAIWPLKLWHIWVDSRRKQIR